MTIQASLPAAKLIERTYGDRFYDALEAFLTQIGSEGAWISKAMTTLEISVWPPREKEKQ